MAQSRFVVRTPTARRILRRGGLQYSSEFIKVKGIVGGRLTYHHKVLSVCPIIGGEQYSGGRKSRFFEGIRPICKRPPPSPLLIDLRVKVTETFGRAGSPGKG